MASWMTTRPRNCKRKRSSSLVPQQLQFFVRMFPTGNSIVMQGSAEERVGSIHERIESRIGIPVREQRLIHSGKQLRWEQGLGECGIRNDATVQLVARLRSGISSEQLAVADNMISIWLNLISEPGISSGVSDSNMLECMRKTFKLNAFKAFVSRDVPDKLVMLYQSNSPGHREIADSAIRLFLDGCDSLFKKGLHDCCFRAVVEFCNSFRVHGEDDCDLYKSLQISLRIVMEECVGDQIQNPNRKVLLKGVFNYVREVAEVLFMELDHLSISIYELPLTHKFENLIAILVPLTDAIRIKGLQAWEGRSRTNEEEYEDEPSLAKEFYYLHLMYSQLLYKVEAGFQDIEDFLDNKKQYEEWWYLYFLILKHMAILSKLIDGAKEMLRGVLMHRGRIISGLINWYIERDEDYEWILEYKSLLDSKDRTHFALLLFPSEMHDDDVMHYMSIDRSNLLVDSFRDIAHERPQALRAGLSIKFSNEEGEGEGVVREWFLLVCQAIFNPLNALFMPCPNDRRRFFPNSASSVNPLHLEYFTFAGRVIALTLLIEVQVGIAFDRVFFKQLAGERITLEDIQEADPYLYNGCKQILEMKADFVDSDALGLTFAREVEELGQRKVIELCPGGESRVVNSENREEYVDLLIQNQFVTSIAEQVSHFAKGFGEIIFNSKVQQFFQLLDLEDFDRILYGRENVISIEDWKQHTDYHGYEETDPQISWFWEVVRTMSAEQQKVLLFFWTSLKYLPFEGFGILNQRLQICNSMEPDHRLPTSRTCYYKLNLPPYSSMATMQDRFSIITQEHISYSFGIS